MAARTGPPRAHPPLALKGASLDDIFDAKESAMRTTITIDDELLNNARELSGINETGPLVKAALTMLVQREAARALARLGGSAPDIVAPPRRRFEPDE